MTFRAWTKDGVATRFHRTVVTNAAARIAGRAGVDAAAGVIGGSEYVSGIVAQAAIQAAQTAQ